MPFQLDQVFFSYYDLQNSSLSSTAMAESDSNTTNECIVCCKNIDVYAVGVCNHPVVSGSFNTTKPNFFFQ